MNRSLSLLMPFTLCLVPLLAQNPHTTLMITLTGTLGPVISGADPLAGNGSIATVTAMIKESAAPRLSTANSIRYTLPAGAVTATLGSGLSFNNTSPWTMNILRRPAHDVLVLGGAGPLGMTFSVTSLIPAASWGPTVAAHPTTFASSPQRLTMPDSRLQYTSGGLPTVLGFTGAVSNRVTVDEAPLDDEAAVAGTDPLSAQATPDATLTMTINGTLGPVLSGPDPLGANGETGTLTVMASESLSPTSSTANSATYTLPAGALSVVIGGTTFKTTGQSTMKITLGAKADTVVLSSTVKELGITATIVGTATLKTGSFPTSVLTHPTHFTPSPQRLTAATTATGGGSKVKYTALGSTTVLGLAGAASNKAAAAVMPEDDASQ